MENMHKNYHQTNEDIALRKGLSAIARRVTGLAISQPKLMAAANNTASPKEISSKKCTVRPILSL